MQDVLGEAGREMSGHVLVWVGARFSACYSDSGLAAGPDRFEGRSRYTSLSPSGCPSDWLATEEGPTAMVLKASA